MIIPNFDHELIKKIGIFHIPQLTVFEAQFVLCRDARLCASKQRKGNIFGSFFFNELFDLSSLGDALLCVSTKGNTISIFESANY